jgi:hypothetical protein
MNAPESPAPLPSRPHADRLWQQYTLHFDLYKTHLDVVIKVLTFYYGITGAILSYYLAHPADDPKPRLALLLPLIFSIGLAVIGFRGSRLVGYTQKELAEIAREFDLKVYAPLTALVNLLRLAGVGCAITAVAILYLLLEHN